MCNIIVRLKWFLAAGEYLVNTELKDIGQRLSIYDNTRELNSCKKCHREFYYVSIWHIYFKLVLEEDKKEVSPPL